MFATFYVVEGYFIRSHHAGARPRLDGHVAQSHTALHRKSANCRTPIFQYIPLAATGADLGDDRQGDVFGRNARGELAVNGDSHRLEWLQRQGLGGQHMLDLTGADTERQGAKCPMG
ncbi:unannotated protein [freshwater metagenome]|uniref:Unannotated protein n=1 Tax=freshwater metagenome TaxID=449393 RepID=A0A6J6UD24_9ZZZZ